MLKMSRILKISLKKISSDTEFLGEKPHELLKMFTEIFLNPKF